MGSLVGFLQGILPAGVIARLGPALATRGPAVGMLAAALGLAALAVVVLWSWGSGYSVLYAGLSGEEGGRTIAELQKLNISYKITEGGRVIMVPSSDVGRARLQLAARGVPKQEGNEWAVLDNESLGVSPFVEQVHYVRGVESALSKTVREVDGVVSAKVSLAMPKETDFLGNSPKPSASVLLRLRPGTELTSAQVDGIVGLVASSVPGLSRDNVTIIDQTGRALSANGKDGLGQAPQQLELSRAITHRYEMTVTDLLVPVLGRGNFRVSADADIDFSQSKESLVKYGTSHVLSQDETTHMRGGEGDANGGIPGALSNRRPDTPVTQPAPPAQNQQTATGDQPPKPEAATPAPPAGPSDSHKTTNYDIDRTVQYLERPSWTLKTISIAVLVNNASGKPLPAERMDAVKKLVSSAIGAGQNPHITVVDLPFEDMTATVSLPGTPWWSEPWMGGVEQNVMLAMAGLLALFGGVLPLLRRVSNSGLRVAPSPARVAAAAAAGGGGGMGRAAGAGGGGPAGPGGRPTNLSEPAAKILAAAQDVFSIEAETVQTLVNNDPARTAQVIRGWMGGDRNGLKQAS